MTTLHLDFETRSRSDLRSVGVYKYVEDSTTAIWGFSYSLNGPIRQWRMGDPVPHEVEQHIRLGGIVKAHNAAFERIIWNKVLRRSYLHLPILAIEQMDCTMVRALALNLPADLDTLAEVLNLQERKDNEGHKLMLRMAKPLGKLVNGELAWLNEPVHVDRLMEYCDQDIRTEMEVDRVLPPLTDDEREMWWIDQRINDRGVPIDRALVARAIELTAYAQRFANDRMRALTDGAVTTCMERDALVAWLRSRGIHVESLRKGDMEFLIAQAELYDDPVAEEALELRQTAAKISTAKYTKTLACLCADGRLHGLLQFDGAAQTGRWAGRLVQPQNYVRVDDDEEAFTVDWTVSMLADSAFPIPDVYDTLELRGPPRLANGDPQNGVAALPWLAKSLRSTIAVRTSDEKLLGGDFSNIEGRVNAWLSGETWKLQAYEAYDKGTGPDTYKLAFARGFGLPVEHITKPQRQIGKVMELACQYQGSIGAFLTLSQTYLLKIHALVQAVQQATPAAEWQKIEVRYENARDKMGLTPTYWTGIKIVVLAWRAAHPNITASWWELQDAALSAIDNPGIKHPVYSGRVVYLYDGSFLYCILPSGRAICYPGAHIAEELIEQIYDGVQWVDLELLSPERLDALLAAGYRVVSRHRRGVRFFGLNENRRWVRQAMYGGFQAENIVQATACDLLRAAMREAEAFGYPLILTVHDELLAELGIQLGTVHDFELIMTRRPIWAGGLPLVAKAWEGVRYNK